MKKIASAGLLSLLSTHAFAIEPIVADETIVTASRIPQLQRAVIGDTTVITSDEIERAGAQSIIELLQAQPGVEINSNGGPGKVSGIFLRGTNTDHVVVLIDGMRVNSATLGTTAFENIPLAQIDKIEILRGPASSLYGADAIGGVIQIFTRKGEGTPKFHAGAGYGSYNTKTAEAGFSGSVKDTSFALNLSSLDTQGFSAYRTRDTRFRDDDGYRNLAFSGSLSHKLATGHEIGVQLYQSEGHTNFDSRFNATSFSDNANLEQLSYSVYSKNQFATRWFSTLKAGEGIDESESFMEFGRTYFKTKQRQYSWQNDITLPVGTLTLLYDKLEQRIQTTAGFPTTDRDNEAYMAGYVADMDAHSVQVNYRSDHNTQFGTNDTGNLGYGYRFNSHWRATASYGTAFKAPSFNDLYFPFFGNPQLKPEKSRNIEASLRYEDSNRNLSLTVYENKIRDLIAVDLVLFQPFNVNDALIRGMTLAGSQRWNSWLLRGNIDVQSPRDENTDTLLVRRANRHASFNLSREWGNWRFGSEMITSSMRYNDAQNTQRLPGYAIFNLTTDYKISPDWKLQARVNNLLDKDYALAYDGDPSAGGFVYNTAGTNLFINVRYSPAK
ncbi:MAG TPA: TonB-dependent receptor [Methylophilaceae bacterium]|nr:TonB-dependent receptor [Methylophilaceae bacterium]